MNCRFANLELALQKYINVPKCTYMGRRRHFGRRRRRKRGRDIPYVCKNKIYFGKRPQTSKGVVSKVLAHLLQNVGDIIGI